MNAKLLPLALLAARDDQPVAGITRFQKLIFLVQREMLDDDRLYDYVPGKYGPFSKALYDDLDMLVDNGFIEVQEEPTSSGTKKVYTLTEDGHKVLQQAQSLSELDTDLRFRDLKQMKSRYNEMDLWELLEHVYQRYPEMAENSKLDIPVPNTGS